MRTVHVFDFAFHLEVSLRYLDHFEFPLERLSHLTFFFVRVIEVLQRCRVVADRVTYLRVGDEARCPRDGNGLRVAVD